MQAVANRYDRISALMDRWADETAGGAVTGMKGGGERRRGDDEYFNFQLSVFRDLNRSIRES